MLVKCAGNAGTWTTYQVLDHTALQGSEGGGGSLSRERGQQLHAHTSLYELSPVTTLSYPGS